MEEAAGDGQWGDPGEWEDSRSSLDQEGEKLAAAVAVEVAVVEEGDLPEIVRTPDRL